MSRRTIKKLLPHPQQLFVGTAALPTRLIGKRKSALKIIDANCACNRTKQQEFLGGDIEEPGLSLIG